MISINTIEAMLPTGFRAVVCQLAPQKKEEREKKTVQANNH